MTHITQLHVYPVKSFAGISLEEAPLDQFGIQYDRHWMLVDETGRFITQRENPVLALIQTQLSDTHLILTFNSNSQKVPLQAEQQGQMQVQVWDDSVLADKESETVNQWLSDIVGKPSFLVRMPRSAPRQNPHHSAVSFADAYPFLICSEESLEFINQHLNQAAEMTRFRPNIVIKGCQPFEEDQWPEIHTATVSLLAKKKCSRCVIPTINPETSEKDNQQILRVLNQFRKEQNKVFFGQNLIYKNPSQIDNSALKVGEEIFFK